MTAVSAVAFRRKRNPETYPCTPFFSLPFVIVMTAVTIMASIDRRELILPFGIPGRYLADSEYSIFFVAVSYFSLVVIHLHSLHFCTMARSTSSRNKALRYICQFKIKPWHFWHFGIFKVCKSARCARW